MASLSTDRREMRPPANARTLGFLLRELYERLQRDVYDAVAAAGHAGIRPVHSPVLRELPAEGGRVSDLARDTGLAKQSVAYVVQDLVALGYLRVECDPADGRAHRLRYTVRGQKLLAALIKASGDAEAALAPVLGAERLQSLRDTLEAARSAAQSSRSDVPAALASRNAAQTQRQSSTRERR